MGTMVVLAALIVSGKAKAADLVIAYDERLLRAASELGFRTASPGAPA
jgi:hypothetical protein